MNVCSNTVTIHGDTIHADYWYWAHLWPRHSRQRLTLRHTTVQYCSKLKMTKHNPSPDHFTATNLQKWHKNNQQQYEIKCLASELCMWLTALHKQCSSSSSSSSDSFSPKHNLFIGHLQFMILPRTPPGNPWKLLKQQTYLTLNPQSQSTEGLANFQWQWLFRLLSTQ